MHIYLYIERSLHRHTQTLHSYIYIDFLCISGTAAATSAGSYCLFYVFLNVYKNRRQLYSQIVIHMEATTTRTTVEEIAKEKKKNYSTSERTQRKFRISSAPPSNVNGEMCQSATFNFNLIFSFYF